MGIGFSPQPLSIEGVLINPSTSMKFLGVILQADLKWDRTIESLCNRIRFAASRIRNEGRFFDQWDRRKLFSGWIMGPIYSNAIAYLPLINASQQQALQVAINAGVRAVANIPPYGYANLTTIREKLGLPNIYQITEKVILTAAWKQKSQCLQENKQLEGPSTRARAKGNIPQPMQKGALANMVSTTIACGWNRLPYHIKNEDDFYKAKEAIKKHVFSHVSP